MANHLKIATWNVNRPKQGGWKNNPTILTKIREVAADIWILTETNCVISPGESYQSIATQPDPSHSAGENCTTIWSHYPIKQTLATKDSQIAVCAEVDLGNSIDPLLVYGTIITWAHDGVLSKEATMWQRHYESIAWHSEDWAKLSQDVPFCVAGDFNEALSEPYCYGTQQGRTLLNEALERSNLVCVTAGSELGYNIDHICLSADWAGRVMDVEKWQAFREDGKPVSDHCGITVTLKLD
ncbi:endonuclease/exonuclease/phosphatase family protein [Leptolyngbya ohadii]|uniref:endonuclease/exonuclease/phosphatase family protein n=1 Tax=Leptolyngbya ohadii TaxID=1962290 RepID=UPI0015C660DD|nr:endonuclease/exonuclease/phosphatase family protein [Leptolyngbya ohadii]